MIRERIHRHYLRTPGGLWREVQRYEHDTWLDRQTNWLVQREDDNRETWWVKRWARLICWACDWRTTWRIRP